MKIQTVTGEIPDDSTGVILPHEHVIIDLRPYWNSPGFFGPRLPRWQMIENSKVGVPVLSVLKENPEAIKDNMVVSDPNDIANELGFFKRAGGGVIVDATTDGMGRNPKGLKKASQLSGVSVVGGAGYYIGTSQSERVRKWSAERMAREAVSDITKGIGDTGIRAGVLGEVGAMASEPDALEQKSMKACALAQAETGVGVVVHTVPGAAMALLDILEDNGADLKKVVAAHADIPMERFDPPSKLSEVSRKKRIQSSRLRSRNAHYSRLLDRRAYIAFDAFGVEYWYVLGDGTLYARPRDIDRVEQIVDLVNRGYLSQILLSGDSCFKSWMRKWGGFSWAHIPLRVAPLLKWAGLSDREIHTLLVSNPAKMLAF